MRKKEKASAIVMTDGKREIIHKLLNKYDIQTAQDIQEALKDLLGGTIKEMMGAEMSRHLGYEKTERSDSDNARNGHKSKRVKSSYVNFSVEVPQYSKSTFAPHIVPKLQKDIYGIDRKIISMYGRGLSTRQISDTIEELYTTNAIESLNATYRQLNRQCSVFANDTALLKALFLATKLATKKWTMPLQNRVLIYGELSIIF